MSPRLSSAFARSIRRVIRYPYGVSPYSARKLRWKCPGDILCLDLGDYDSAATHARTARACAEAAGHEGMLAWVRAVESLIAYWTGQYERAAQLAQVGRQHREGAASGHGWRAWRRGRWR
ncbi:hypothetical protein ACH4VM_13375 [Streptomyces sp. NPDC020792]|uniref:hypothetical protein n=1 Tax=Streptomyces sp. NPDC020792 TaxID=3365089 RepID=UPI0037A22C96